MAYNNSFQQFCGGQFWDEELTWEGDSPQFTLCFQATALIWVPCAFLWLMLIPYSCYLSSLKRPVLPWSKLILLKMVFGSLLAVTSICDFVKGAVDYYNGQRPAVYIVSPIVLAVTLITAIVLIYMEKKHGIASSGVLFLFYLLLIIAGIIPFYMKILDPAGQGFQYDPFRFLTFYVYYFFLLVQFVLHCFGEKVPQPIYFAGKEPCPETNASFLSRMTFNWVLSLVIKGYKTTLQEKDMYAPHPRDMAQVTGPIFERAWKKELAKTHRKQTRRKGKQKAGITEKTALLEENIEQVHQSKKTKKKSASLLKVLAKVYGFTLLKSHMLKLIYDLVNFIGPLLQSLMIDYIEDPYIQEWKGYLYALMFFIYPVINSIFFNQMFHIGFATGMRLKAALISAIYKKALSMSNEARKKSTVGEIVTLMSVDVQRIQDVAHRLWLLWSGPLQITLALYFLWGILGPSVLTGLAIILLLIPINGWLGRFQRKYQIAVMRQKDKRIKTMNEILNGIKVLKLYTWELSFKERVDRIRNFELDILKKAAIVQSFVTFITLFSPFMVTLACFVTFTLTGGILDANKAFVSLTLFNMIRFPINMLPQFINSVIVAFVSLKRISTFLQHPDIDQYVAHHKMKSETTVDIDNGTFAWGSGKDDPVILKNININMKQGELVAVVGNVGCGKSSLLSALLGEMEKLQGVVNVTGSVAYVSQQAWIQNKTLRDNVLFGTDVDEAYYDEVLDACALKPDLDMLPGADLTEIGEKGINLSGGQKQRVSLARAVYSDADVYLLDDPLSAVDSHVGKHIFERVVGEKGLLKNKTRLLVTHGIHWLPRVDKIIVLVNGAVTEMGTYQQLLSHNGDFAQFLKTYLITDSSSEEDEEIKKEKLHMLEQVAAVVKDDTDLSTDRSDSSSQKKLKKRKCSSHRSPRKAVSQSKPEVKTIPKQGQKLTTVERAEIGKVKWSVFHHYCKAIGTLNAILWLFIYILYHTAQILSNIWLSVWSEDQLIANSSMANTPIYAKRRDLYLGVYGGLGFLQAVFVFTYTIISLIGMIRAAKKMHGGMLNNILHSPMAFFDTTPVGRIINRFSRDVDVIDSSLPGQFRGWLQQLFTMLSTIVVISYSTPIFLAVIVPIGILYYFIQRFYIPTSRQLKRIESTTRSPIFVHFSETITGASTIRAFGAQNRFIQTSDNMVDNHQSFYFGGIATNRWLGVNLDFLGGLIVFAAALFAVIGKDTLSGGIVGLSLSYALQVTKSLAFLVRMSNELEINIVSVERVKEYTETPSEADWFIEESSPSKFWPDEGKVSMDDYSTKYRPHLDLVLNNISFDIGGGEKVGIVGRTGAGKSSLTLALFRIIEAVRGSVIIDGIHIGTLGLHQLRSKITILPQDPVLFSGTIRMNLDPFDIYTDDEIWTSLEHAHFKSRVSSLPTGLLFECEEGGRNFSVGEKQLICLARALLRKTKILIFDEATAAIDLETDDLIQNTIRREFADCTVLTIAHRLNTVMDSDRILVLDNGNIAEFDSPSALLEDPTSIFYSMAKNASLI